MTTNSFPHANPQTRASNNNEIRTTPDRSQPPQASASTNSATRAFCCQSDGVSQERAIVSSNANVSEEFPAPEIIDASSGDEAGNQTHDSERPMIHIGFTGTRRGMTDAQRRAVDQAVCDAIGGDTRLNVVAHHGDCTGADAQFHIIAEQYGAMMVGHIPDDDTYRAFARFDDTRDPLPYLKRNSRIVEAATHMIAAPGETTEQQRGGTWATIRMARKAGRPLVIVYPNGTMEGEWP